MPGRCNILKKKYTIFLLILLLGCIVCFINRLTLKQWFQLSRLQALECPENRPDCRDILWLHKVNSLRKYEQLQSHFPGFESDITFIDSLRAFYVFHPNSEDSPLALSWKQFAAGIDLENKKWYIDLRGVTEESAATAIAAFEVASDTALLKKQAIIELYDYKVAEVFQKAGYNVALNYENLRPFLTAENRLPDAVLQKTESISQICGDASLLEEMKKTFPGKKYLIWELSYKNYLNMEKIEKHLKDSDVLIVLVSVSS